MPKDLKGRDLKPGDEVLVRATVVQVYENDAKGAYNVNIQVSDHGSTGEVPPSLTLNSRLIEVVTTSEPDPHA